MKKEAISVIYCSRAIIARKLAVNIVLLSHYFTFMSKVYFFTGEETYLTHKEILKRKTNFTEKYGTENVLTLWLPEYSANAIIEQITNAWLFSNEKLIIIQWVPWETTSAGWTSDLEEKIIQMRWSINPDYFIIFVSSKPDKRKKAYKFFSDPKHCQMKVFESLSSWALVKHIEQEIRDHLDEQYKTIKIEKDIINLIIERTQGNLRTIHNECHKLSLSVNSWRKLDVRNVSSIISWQGQDTMFVLIDTIVMRHKDIFSIIDNIRHEGKAIQEILGWLLRWLKIIISYTSIISIDMTTPSIASLLGVPPFSIAKYKGHNEYMKDHTNYFIWLYNDILDFDFQLKSWRSDEQSFRPLLITSLQKHHLI